MSKWHQDKQSCRNSI